MSFVLSTDGAGHDSHDISHIILSAADRVPPSPAQLASITCPILILSGTDDKVVSPLVAAEEWKKAFKGAKGGATIASITGAPHLMSLSDFVSWTRAPSFDLPLTVLLSLQSIVNRMIMQFTSRALQG